MDLWGKVGGDKERAAWRGASLIRACRINPWKYSDGGMGSKEIAGNEG
ncbi:hypothetical protein GYH30_029713 [Glycine max]|nr:hypothetical protein GYH30_029713 [Glycine max]